MTFEVREFIGFFLSAISLLMIIFEYSTSLAVYVFFFSLLLIVFTGKELSLLIKLTKPVVGDECEK